MLNSLFHKMFCLILLPSDLRTNPAGPGGKLAGCRVAIMLLSGDRQRVGGCHPGPGGQLLAGDHAVTATWVVTSFSIVHRALVSKDVTRSYKMSPDVPRCHQMSLDVTRCHKYLQMSRFSQARSHGWFLKWEDLFGRNVTIASCSADKATVGQIPRQPSWHPVLSSAIIPLHHCTAY